ncbi:MAG: hypothetical protein IKI29_07010 [Clostridia bacterium]|nr:hypothetical protein [Clostridia bacterium]
MDKDFFDQALLKAKEAFDVARKKTTDVVSIQRQRFEVTSLTAKMEKDYAELGEIFFEQIKDSEDMPENVRLLVEAIQEKIQRISELNLEIAQTKNKKVCPDCQGFSENNARFCSHCGAPFEEE